MCNCTGEICATCAAQQETGAWYEREGELKLQSLRTELAAKGSTLLRALAAPTWDECITILLAGA